MKMLINCKELLVHGGCKCSLSDGSSISIGEPMSVSYDNCHGQCCLSQGALTFSFDGRYYESCNSQQMPSLVLMQQGLQ